MTTGMDDICKDLQTELKSLVCKINPSERGSERYRPHDPKVQGEITEKSGRPRTFWITPVSAAPTNMGASTRRYEMIWHLVVGYPTTDWDICAISDFDDIRAAVNAFGGFSTATGVGFRSIPPGEDALTFSRDENWLWATIKILAIVETTTTAKTMPNYQTKSVATVTVAASPVTVYSFAATRDGSISWSYHVIYSDGKASRAGLISAAWDISAATATYYEESSEDIVASGAGVADTSYITFDVSVSGSTVSLTATSTSGTWTVRTTELARSDE